MRQAQDKVRLFHTTFNIKTNQVPTLPTEDDKKLRVTLIQEEFDELKFAFEENDLIEIADALGDLLYVILGTGVTCGINLAPVFDAIHDSNMTKVGGYVRGDGKYMKPPTYTPVNLLPILAAQFTKEDSHGQAVHNGRSTTAD